MLAPLLGLGFVAVMVAVHWYWSEFLLSPAARNWFFGVDKWDYTTRVGPWRYEYWNTVPAMEFARSMSWTLLAATISSFLGLWIGRAMAKVQR